MAQFSAYFYKLEHPYHLNCRKSLDIKSDTCLQARPDLTVVLLNPGSCRSDTKVFDRDTVVRADPTLHRIKHLLGGQTSIQWIRVINLSDIIEPKSEVFFDIVEELDTKGYDVHSIFSPTRRPDLSSFLEEGDIVAFACGTNPKNHKLLSQALDTLQSLKVKIINIGNQYYHPLVRPNKERGLIDWREQMRRYYSQHRFCASGVDG